MKDRIKTATLNLVGEFPHLITVAWHNIWWNAVDGTVIKIPWPRGWIKLDESTQALSDNPYEHYAPWFRKHVGRQHWDWDWRANDAASISYQLGEVLVIKVRKNKEKYLAMFLLTFDVESIDNKC